MSCRNAPAHPAQPPGGPHPSPKRPDYAWTDLTYLLHKHHVSWRYYIFKGIEPDCESNARASCAPVTQGPRTNPDTGTRCSTSTRCETITNCGDIQSLNGFFAAAHKQGGSRPSHGSCPTVSSQSTRTRRLVSRWADLCHRADKHDHARTETGTATAIFLSWDDWGGFYDNVVPPVVDQNGYVPHLAPGIVISPYAKKGYIDNLTLEPRPYVKIHRGRFPCTAHGIDPRHRRPAPNPRPGRARKTPRSSATSWLDFDFNQKPRAPLILPVCPKTDLMPKPRC